MEIFNEHWFEQTLSKVFEAFFLLYSLIADSFNSYFESFILVVCIKSSSFCAWHAQKIVLIYSYTQHWQKNMCNSQLNWANSFAFFLFIPLQAALRWTKNPLSILGFCVLIWMSCNNTWQIKKSNNRLSKCYSSNQIIAACVPLGLFSACPLVSTTYAKNWFE